MIKFEAGRVALTIVPKSIGEPYYYAEAFHINAWPIPISDLLEALLNH